MLGGRRVAKIALAIAALVLAGYLLRLLTWDAEDEYGIALADTAVADAAERACARSGGTFAVSRPGDDYLAVLARAHGEDFATALKRGDTTSVDVAAQRSQAPGR